MKKLYFPTLALLTLLFLSGGSFAQENVSTASIQKIDEEKIYKQSEVDQKAKITKRQHPSTDRMCDSDAGSVKLQVTLHKSGKVSDVKLLVSSECQRFNENALAAAKKIKFNPALDEGQPVSVTVIVEFTYRKF